MHGDLERLERHVWSVLSNSETVATPDGTATAYKLSYVRRGDTALYWTVPGFGLAKFNDFDNKRYQVCAARVCDSAGTCTGAPSCDELNCS